MNFPYFIARKVAGSGRHSFSRLIIRIAVTAVAISVAVMICTTALITGFKKEISSKVFGFWGHIHITDSGIDHSILELYPISKKQGFYPDLDTVGQVDYPVYDDWMGDEGQRWKRTNGGIKHIQVFALKPGIIDAKSKTAESGREIEGIILKGIDRDFDWEFMERYIKEGKPLNLTDTTSSEIMVSMQTANRLGLEVGDRFTIHFVEQGEQIKRRFSVCGFYKTGLDEYDRKFALVDIRQIQTLLNWTNDEVAGFEVFIDDIDDLEPLTEYIYFEQLPNNLFAENIEHKFPEIFQWLELQDTNEVVILVLMVIVAIINMITALLILILERTNMIGVLKALGTSNWNIRKVFLYYAGYIITLGLFWGNLIGIGLCLLQKHFELIKLSEADYYISVAPIQLNMQTILLLNLGTFLVTLVFLVFPTYLITRISPVNAIRFK